MIVAAADGSALSNPGPAGWAWYIDENRWARGGWSLGTNNMGELMAVLDLLRQTAGTDEPLHVLCDSQYVINSVTKWMPGWRRRGWKKSDGKPVLNVDLMKELDAALRGRAVTFEWVKGHSGHDLNEFVDELAREAATAYRDGEIPSPGPGFNKAAQSTEPAGPEVDDGPSQESLLDVAAQVVVKAGDYPSADELVSLYRSVGWTAYTSDSRLLKQAIDGSSRVVTAREGRELVGLARVISDGASIAYLQDILVRPSHQRSGLGRRLMTAALFPYEHVRQTVLITDDEPEQKAFYESLGFTELSEVPGRAFVRFRR